MNDLFPGVTTSDLAGRAAKVLTPNYRPAPLVLVSGQGCRVTDKDGKTYLDMVGGIAVNSLGHNHPRLVAAIADQAAKLIHVSNLYLNEPAVAFAELVKKLTFADRVFLANSGTEANEAALKIARRFQAEVRKSPHQAGVLAFHDSFHGRSMFALSATGQPKYHHGFEPLVPGVRFATFGNLEQSEAEMADGKVGAIIVEPVQCEGGINMPPPGFLEGLRALADRHGAVLIFDEVQTGVGRTGKWFYYQHTDVVPDVLTTAKGVAGGVPLGVMMCNETVAPGFQPGTHASTFGGNALATRAGLEVFNVIAEEGLLENAAARGEQLGRGLDALRQRHPDKAVAQRGRGLVQGLELVDAALVNKVVDACREKGLLVNAVQGKTLRFVPSLTVNAAEIEEALGIVGGVLAAVRGA